MVRYTRFLFLVALSLSLTPNLFAQSGTALTLRVGTLGAEVGLARAITSSISVRGGVNYFTYALSGETGSEDPVAYDLDINYFSVPVLLDIHVTRGFRLYGGALFNNNIIEGTGMTVDNWTFDDDVYTPADLGTLTVKVQGSLSISPYAGIGFGNPVAAGRRLGFFVDIGAFYQGSPDVTLAADADAMIYPTITQEADVEADIKNLTWYPVLAFGLSFQF